VLIKTVNVKKIAIVGLDLFDHNFEQEKTKEIFDAVKPYSDYRIAFIHWGTEYTAQPQDKQKEIAHQIIDLGADIILGHHPHVVQSVEIYNNKPIFYSLGNFVFDQYFSKETQEGLGVQIKLLPYQIQYELLPINIAKSQPQFMQGDDKEKFLNYLAKISDLDENISNQIKNGYLSLDF
jgi:poly-gamma-glutamate capsule biosynthesis protein CapA/YwtB (metallophosphatase superfamily)